jgi:hypothetical protein
MMNLPNDAWRNTAEQASVETDPKRLTDLIAKLCKELDGVNNTQRVDRDA